MTDDIEYTFGTDDCFMGMVDEDPEEAATVEATESAPAPPMLPPEPGTLARKWWDQDHALTWGG